MNIETICVQGGYCPGSGEPRQIPNAVAVGGAGEFFDIQHGEGRVGDGLAEDGLCVGAEGGVQL